MSLDQLISCFWRWRSLWYSRCCEMYWNERGERHVSSNEELFLFSAVIKRSLQNEQVTWPRLPSGWQMTFVPCAVVSVTLNNQSRNHVMLNGWNFVNVTSCRNVSLQVVPNYSSRQHYDTLFALGATLYVSHIFCCLVSLLLELSSSNQSVNQSVNHSSPSVKFL